uniref:C2H2-type domain-containing protein n=1 Tax=Parascaris equorum TaxID=6256 RepID=A0A914RHJ8_PAREQ
MTTSARPSTVMSADALRSSTNGKLAPGMGDTPCRTSCEICGLVMVKPSLLIRHMLRVHNRQCFSATIQVRGMPDIKAELPIVHNSAEDTNCMAEIARCYVVMNAHRTYHFAVDLCDAFFKMEFYFPEAVFFQDINSCIIDGTVSTEERSQQVVSSTDPEVLHLVEAEQSSEHSGDIFVLLVADQDTGGGLVWLLNGNKLVPGGYHCFLLGAITRMMLRALDDRVP